jgi:deoxyribose-phosphate aldolase
MKTVKEILDQSYEYNQELPPLPAGSGELVRPVSRYLDSALHKTESTPAEVRKLCEDALQWQIAGVYTNPVYLPLVVDLLKNSTITVGSIAGFPLGGFLSTTKVFEAETYINMGASEIDMVLSVGQLKSGEYQVVLDDISAVAQKVHSKGKIIKVILETSLLTRQEKIIACLLAQAGQADFVKTSTGFSNSGATVEDVDLMRRVVGNTMKVKASAGIHTLDTALALIHAGADRLGTSKAALISADAEKMKVGAHG